MTAQLFIAADESGRAITYKRGNRSLTSDLKRAEKWVSRTNAEHACARFNAIHGTRLTVANH